MCDGLARRVGEGGAAERASHRVRSGARIYASAFRLCPGSFWGEGRGRALKERPPAKEPREALAAEGSLKREERREAGAEF